MEMSLYISYILSVCVYVCVVHSSISSHLNITAANYCLPQEVTSIE